MSGIGSGKMLSHRNTLSNNGCYMSTEVTSAEKVIRSNDMFLHEEAF